MGVDAGEILALPCVAFGIPGPSVFWQRNGVNLSNDNRTTIIQRTVTLNGLIYSGSILEICNLGEEDSTSYSCNAINTYASVSSAFDVVVHVPGNCILIYSTYDPYLK